ncbi:MULTISPECIES: phytoene desaturase family protein [Spiribacter]|jgi:phytoene desaturase|uniref:Phytoene dehydrogenase n=1 Tax=Spiribacter aquaticus TaxID=1935996 RepID=A0A557RFF6_9GAMM|nr:MULTISPECIES: phytoene desaturase family protein [Spiribacter]AUB78474.1 phytoene dehydrogenase [Spiribacter roseus]KAF0280436.1 phytoene dehydrogenase [Spiribacter roseus]KAF0283422.1 phytoene dehydrogenase [Spiribacter roseus]TVO63863.1 phytoene desaturase [Spiribacter aquaticus]
MHSLVMGGGFGGIAAALRLRARGHEVTLIDRCPRLGGRAQVFERHGYRHDAGPTVITAPFLFAELFELFGESLHDHLELRPLDPWYRFRFPDDSSFDYGPGIERMESEIARFNPADVAGYHGLLAESRELFEIGFRELGYQPFHRLSFMARQIPRLLRLRFDRSVWTMVARHIKHPYLRRALSLQPLLVGGNPFDTTCIYGLIHYLEREWGVHFAMGGTGALVGELAGLLERQGVRVENGRSITAVHREGRRITGASVDDGRTLKADHFVSNLDPMHLYGELMDPAPLAARVKHRLAQTSMGLFVLYFGTDCTYPDVAHHTIWLGDRYRELLRDIFDRKILSEDFSLYLHRPTATDPSFAPPGHDSFYVLAPVPNQLGDIDWASEGPRLQARIVEALEATLMPGLSTHLRAAFYMTPDDFRENYQSVHGSGFTLSPLFRQSAWFRFHNQAEGLDNLYLVGAGTHPGAGMPGVLSSAKVLERLFPEGVEAA